MQLSALLSMMTLMGMTMGVFAVNDIGDPNVAVVDVINETNRMIDVDPGDQFWLTVPAGSGVSAVRVQTDGVHGQAWLKAGEFLPVRYDEPGEYTIRLKAAQGQKIVPFTVRVFAPPTDAGQAVAGTKGDGTLVATASPSFSLGSVYAGLYANNATNKFPLRIVSRGAGDCTVSKYGGGWSRTYSFAAAGEQSDVVDVPAGQIWTLVKGTGGTHTLSTNSPSRLKVVDLVLVDGPAYAPVGQSVANTNLFMFPDDVAVFRAMPGPAWVTNNPTASHSLFEWTTNSVDYVPFTGLSNSVAATTSSNVVQVACHSPNTTPVSQKTTIIPPQVDIGIHRLDGTRVDEASEDKEGSIVNVFYPYRNEFEPAISAVEPPNNKLDLEFSWNGIPESGFTCYLMEDGPGSGKGEVRVYDSETLLKGENETFAELPIDTWTSPKTLQIEGVQPGVLNLVIVVVDAGGSVLCSDRIRVTTITDLPASGRIIFVNPSAAGSAPFDDYEYNAAPTISDALASAQPDDNIVVAPGLYQEGNLNIQHGCVLAGIGGRIDGNIETTYFDATAAATINAMHTRMFTFGSSLTINDSVRITGLTLTGAYAESGAVMDLGEQDTFSLFVSFCDFADNEAIGTNEITDFWDTLEGDDLGSVTTGGAQLSQAVGDEPSNLQGGSVLRKVFPVGSPYNPIIFRNTTYQNQKAKGFGGVFLVMRGVDPAAPAAALNNIPNALAGGGNIFPVYTPIGLQVISCNFFNCEAVHGGGAIAAMGTFVHKQVGRGMTSGVPVQLLQCRFQGNKVSKGEGGGHARGGAVHISGMNSTGSTALGCTFVGNQAVGPVAGDGDGGAVAILFGATLNIDKVKDDKGNWRYSILKFNQAADGGGAIYVTYFSVVRANEVTIESNKSDMGGGGCHVTSGSVLDLVKSSLKDNRGKLGGVVFNRNSRLDVRECDLSQNTATESSGAVYALCVDDSGGKLAGAWKYPESSVNPCISRLLASTQLKSNTAPICGAMEVKRILNDTYTPVAEKALKYDIINASVTDNVATAAADATYGIAGGIGLMGTDETVINTPVFNRNTYKQKLQAAFEEWYPVASRWPIGNVFTTAQVATYVADIMLWGLNDQQIANDSVENSTFTGNTNYQGSTSNGLQPAHMIKNGNVVIGPTRPNGLF